MRLAVVFALALLADAARASAGYDVVLLAGQSNMVGYGGPGNPTDDPRHPRLDMLDMSGKIVQAYVPLSGPEIGSVSPGYSYGLSLVNALPADRRVLLVQCSVGSTGFSNNRWNPGDDLYKQAVNRANAAITAGAVAQGEAHITAILWLQGEADSGWTEAKYAQHLDAMIAGFRSDITGGANVPFIVASMMPEFIAANGASAVDAAHQKTPARNYYTAFVRGPSGYQSDTYHYQNTGVRIIGADMYAALPAALVNSPSGGINGFANPGFETPVTNTSILTPTGGSWIFAGNSGIQHNGSAWGATNALGGTQTAFVQGNGNLGSISQSVTFTPGTYTVSFYAAQRSGQIQPIQVRVDGTALGTFTPASGDFGLITTPAFTVSAGSHTVTLAATDNSGDKTSFIDYVAIARIPSARSMPTPTHWWKMDESSGAAAVDSAGTNNGTLSAFTIPTWNPTGGKVGGCLNLSGNWQSVPVGTINLTSEYTVTAWVKMSASASSNQPVFSNQPGGTNENGCSLFINNWGGADHKLYFHTGNGGGGSYISSNVTVTPGVWQHVAVTVDNNTGVAKLYLNGTIVGTGSVYKFAQTNAGVTLGKFTTDYQGLNGSLDDVKIFNTVLSATEIASIYVLSPYTAWQNSVFTQADLANLSISGDTATPAGDGISNLMKYALNLNPKTSSSDRLPVLGTTVDASNNSYLTLTYTQAISAVDVIYTVEVSGDLQTWNSGPTYTSIIAANNPDGITRTVVARDLTPMGGATRRFIRMKVSRP